MLIISNRTVFKSNDAGWHYGFINYSDKVRVFVPQQKIKALSVTTHDWVLADVYKGEKGFTANWCIKLTPQPIKKPTIVSRWEEYGFEYVIIQNPTVITSQEKAIKVCEKMKLPTKTLTPWDSVKIEYIHKFVVHCYFTEHFN